MRAELRFAVEQLRVEVGATANASRIIAAGAALAVLATAFALLACMFALSRAMPSWLASLIVSGAAAVAGGALIYIGRRRFARQRTPAFEGVVSTTTENGK